MAIVFTVNQVYNLLLAYHYHNQQCVANFYLKADVVTNSAEDPQSLMEEWVESELDKIAPLVNTDVNFFYCRLSHMFLPGEGTFERSIDVNGEQVISPSKPLPAFVTAGYRLITTNGVSNSGWLRFSGLVASDLSADGESYSPADGSATEIGIPAFQEMMTGQFATPEANIFSYVVMSQYLGALNPLNIASVSLPKLGTQNSRKLGVGV